MTATSLQVDGAQENPGIPFLIQKLCPSQGISGIPLRLRSWTPFTIMLYACVWMHSGLQQQSVCVQATEPPLALRRKKLALQYCLKLSANTNNPAYNAVFNSKFETQFDNKPSQTRLLGFRDGWICMKFCTGGLLVDVITCFKLCQSVVGLGSARGQILPFSIDLAGRH